MPAPLSPLIGFALGLLFAWASSEELLRAAFPGRSLLVATLFGLLVHAPITAYFLALSPDWAYAYWIDSQRLPPIVDLGLVLLSAASVPAGFALGIPPVRAHSLSGVLKLASVPSLLGVAFVLGTLPRLSVQSTYAQYHGDFGRQSIAGSALGYAVLFMLLVMTGAVLWTLRQLRLLSRRGDGWPKG